MTNFFIFFEVDNILGDEELTCRLYTYGNCDDITHISGKYLKNKDENKCYNLKKPDDIEWNLNQYKPHHYDKLKIYDDEKYSYNETNNNKDIFNEKYEKNKINIKWLEPASNDDKYYKLDCENFNYNEENFNSGLICEHK